MAPVDENTRASLERIKRYLASRSSNKNLLLGPLLERSETMSKINEVNGRSKEESRDRYRELRISERGTSNGDRRAEIDGLGENGKQDGKAVGVEYLRFFSSFGEGSWIERELGMP
ncbi:hypothetical protein Droror1_Dr00023962 [Drosera rotundifolia]